jgi:uncharacterized repeat protein (TIGR03843 family)
VSPDERAPTADALTVLHRGDVAIQGRMPWSSNGTFLVTLTLDGVQLPAVYKPHRGERELWDFPDGLFLREVAAYELSVALGWGVVPETVLRHDAPLGVGSLQRFVPADFSEHYFTLLERPEHGNALRTIAAFDMVANNADRKGGHCLLGEDGRIWGIDNGLCFHVEDKLRTVMWDFAAEPIPAPLLADMARVAEAPPVALRDLIHAVEIEAMVERACHAVAVGTFPEPPPGHRAYPWPLV